MPTDATEIRNRLHHFLLNMVATSLNSGERSDLVRCFRVADEEADAAAESMALPPRDFYQRWIDAFLDEFLSDKDVETQTALVAAINDDSSAAMARLYIAWNDFAERHASTMQRELDAMRIQCPSDAPDKSGTPEQ